MGRLFGTDGVRGVANADLTAELALGLSVAAAHVLAEAGTFEGLIEAVQASHRTWTSSCTARGFLDTRCCYAAAFIEASAANHSRLV